jgi:hypothetical protein
VNVSRHFRILTSAFCLLTSSAIACTIGAFGTGSTSDGRPVLWKNRDVSNANQAMRFLQGSRFRYVTNIYAGDTLNAWAGINEAGFAIMNSNSFNIDDDDGTVMNLALGSCASLDDFARLLDSLNVNGRQTPANYGAFDATGSAAVFEASNDFYVRHNTSEDSLDFLIRANYSMSGNPARQTGRNRYLRAMQLALPVAAAQLVDVRFVVRTLARDLGALNFDPYPLPFDSVLGGLPRGFLPTESSLCRVTTRSVEVMVGPRPGASPATGMMWVMLGPAEVSLPIPLWVQAGPVHEFLGGEGTALLCDEALRLHEYVHSSDEFPAAVNTFRLSDMYSSFVPTESALFVMVDSAEDAWGVAGPSPEQARAVTDRAVSAVLNAYLDFWDRVNRESELRPIAEGCGTWQNVSRDTVLLRLPAGAAAGRVLLYDAAGRRVADMTADAGRLKWAPTGIKSGSYFIVFPTDSGLAPQRFIYCR